MTRREEQQGDLPIGALLGGLASVALLLIAVWGTQRTIDRDLDWVEAVGRIEADVAIAHLWVEELVAGDPVDAAEIDRRLDQAARLAGTMASRSASAGADEDPLVIGSSARSILPLPEGPTRNDALAVTESLDTFRTLCDERRLAHDRGLQVSAGSRFDQEFDAAFRSLLDRIDSLRTRLESQRARGDRLRTIRFGLVALAWIGALAAVTAALRRYDRSRLRAERALASSHDHLERSQRLEAVGRLARGLAHDLNNYLAAVRSQCELVATRALRAETSETRTLIGRDVAERMRAVLDTVDKASSLLADLLTFGRRHPSRTARLAPGERIAAMAPMLRASAGGAVRLHLDIDQATWQILIDPARFDQAILNLVVNARDAMPEGGELRLIVRDLRAERFGRADGASRVVAADDRVELQIVDTGVGIPPDDLEEIFEPFVTRKGGEHSGLGLAMVYAVARQSGGTVAVDSAVGRGTTFRLSFPRAEADPQEDGSAAGAGAEPGSGAAATRTHPAAFDPRGEETLLFVDDNEEYREATAALLETLGYRVATAASGEQAEQLFQDLETLDDAPSDRRVDLLVADIVMAGVDGRTLARRLRARRPDLPVVLLSGDPRLLEATPSSDPSGARVDDFEWVRKESSTAALTHAMRRALDRSLAEARRPGEPTAPSPDTRSGAPSSSGQVDSAKIGASEDS